MAKTKKYVRIKKASGSRYWYTDKIGEVFEVAREDNADYVVYNGSIDGCLVAKEDAELIVTEKRPAEVGERVLITEKPVRKDYEIYEPVTVDNVNIYGVESYKNGRPIFLNHYEYEVIVSNEVKNEEADEMNKMLVDQAKTVFERKDDKYFGYKSRLGDIVIGGAYSYAFVVHYAKTNEDVVIIPGDVNTVTTPVCTTEAERLWKPEKTAQERRDEIVEQAKADVEELSNYDGIGRYVILEPLGNACDIEFIINRDKRTVVCLLKGINSSKIYARGIAKAAPDDCFNEHIGEAIALHRALGLEVPDEYLNAPQPTEVRVGDVVAYRGFYKTIDYVTVVADGEPTGGGRAALTSIAVKHGKIIDDSRTGVGE
ncbi:hypothetical protein MHH84_08180 [Bacillus sp. FSL K6-1109]|uniref:Uncharacterized protein n=2 Tax=Bacteria TaxID=2 RepID=A0AB37GLC5_BACLI|nr:hypothetical protein [Bacillus licheniformis]AOP13965.1 hypothetical protein BL1202_01014 [Bacillus licheniformis]MCM3377656.1 hypothetical protein [Bacillus licheniformis]MCM3432728.1 hypothetical protein [Bacillus licheniformis]MCM3465644.1 hypothetical protein [Bacillus licheniformis]MCM3750430.1 hypothetical protein [Bacillus licheniformis]